MQPNLSQVFSCTGEMVKKTGKFLILTDFANHFTLLRLIFMVSHKENLLLKLHELHKFPYR